MTQFIVTLVKLSWVILALSGIALAVIGYRQGRRKIAFALFLVYFISSLYVHTLRPTFGRWAYRQYVNATIDGLLEQYAEYEKEKRDLDMRYPAIDPGTTISYIRIPFGQMALVLGMWFLIKKEKEIS